MSDTVLKQCYFCREWFPAEQIKEVSLNRNPSASYEAVFSCENCLKVSRTERLTAKALKALEYGGFNEVELTEGDLKIHLVRFTPAPYYATAWVHQP